MNVSTLQNKVMIYTNVQVLPGTPPLLDPGREGDKTPKLHFCFLKASKLFRPVVMDKLLSSPHQSTNWRWTKSLSLPEPLLLALPRAVPYTQEFLLEISGSFFEFTSKGLYAVAVGGIWHSSVALAHKKQVLLNEYASTSRICMAPQDQCQGATKMYPWLFLGMGLPLCISHCYVRIRLLSNLELEAKRANIDFLKGNSGSENTNFLIKPSL